MISILNRPSSSPPIQVSSTDIFVLEYPDTEAQRPALIAPEHIMHTPPMDLDPDLGNLNASSGGQGLTIEDTFLTSSIFKRPTRWRKDVRTTVEARMPVDQDSNKRCLGCDGIVDGSADLDHYPTLSGRQANRDYDSRKKYLDDYNNIDELRGLCTSCNRSHRFENTPTEDLPYYNKYFGGPN